VLAGGFHVTPVSAIFEELLFGSGFWIGFLLIFVICIAASYRYKYSGIVCEFVLFFLAISYNENIDASSSKMWGIIFCFIGMILIGVQLYGDATSD
jgi:hypothetical protein